jgi:hypothetical protein
MFDDFFEHRAARKNPRFRAFVEGKGAYESFVQEVGVRFDEMSDEHYPRAREDPRLNVAEHKFTAAIEMSEREGALTCAPDASSLAVFYESGKAELYRCILRQDERPASLEFVVEFRFHLPECGDPVVTWHDGAFWFQARTNALARVSIESPQVSEEQFPARETGELSALVFGEDTRLVALRQGRDTSLLAPGAPSLRRPGADVNASCVCGSQRVAIAFSDGALVVYESAAVLTPKAEVRAGVVRGALGFDRSRLLWLAESRGFCAWRLGESTVVSVQDNQEVFPNHLHVIPSRWFCRSDGTILLVTTHSVIAFHLFDGGTVMDSRLETVFGGPVWRAVRKQDGDQWLLESHPLREVLLGRGVMGRLYCAPDSKGHFFAASGSESGFVLQLATLQQTPLRGCPLGLNLAVGDSAGGCWFVDRAGDIYLADVTGHCQCVARIGLPDVHGAQLRNCGDYLVWFGYSIQFFRETGADPARTFVFFRKHREVAWTLERLGEQFRQSNEGLCVAVCYDEATERLVTLWVKAQDGNETYSLKAGPVHDFTAWHFQETEVTGLGRYRFVQADLSADGRLLGVVNSAGEFSCLSIADGRVVATLAGSAPFTAVTPGAEGPKFWLVETRLRIYRCSLLGKT